MGIRRLSIVSLVLAVHLAPVLADGEVAGPSTPGSLAVVEEDGTLLEMPLRHTGVRIDVSAFVARVEIEQVFANPFEQPVEAVYTFPLGHRAAVDDFEMVVGERVIRGEIRRREEARRVYEQARSQGYRAALLEQERPNVFTQSVANIEPGGEIRIRIRTFETLPYESGVYELTFPLVVGPRYVPGGSAGDGTPEVPDADRITPPVIPPGFRSGHDVDIAVSLDAGVPLGGIESPGHRIELQRDGASRASVRLAADDRIPNKDFVLHWDVAAVKPRLGLLAHRDGVDGFFTLLVQPKGEVAIEEATPKEIVFVLDTSGSMRGVPLDASKRFVERALKELGPRDTFNLIAFAGGSRTLSEEPLFNEPVSIERALAWLRELDGRGGTQMLEGFRAAFARPADPDRLRLVLFLTDGFIGNEDQIFRAIGDVVGDSRIYTLGIGSSVNHFLLERMARLGRGGYRFVLADETAERALESFRSWVTRPYLTDLEIDWGALPVMDVVPERPADLFSGQTLDVVGRYVGAGAGTVTVRGKLGGRYWEQSLDVVLPATEPAHASLASLWARHRIEELMTLAAGRPTPAIEAEVTALALEYRLMSRYTSFVAVDDTEVVDPEGDPRRIEQALPLPEGVSFEGVFGPAGPPGLRPGGQAVTGADDEAEPVGQVREHALGLTEEVRVVRQADVVELDKTTLRFSDEFVADRRAAGRFYTSAVMLEPGVEEKMTVGAERSRPRRKAAADVAAVGPMPEQARNAYLLESALRVLADLAEDGVLSPAEGRPALAALMAAQDPAGAIADDVPTHTIATWALLEAAAVLPGEAWVIRAAGLAEAHLADRTGDDGSELPRQARTALAAIRDDTAAGDAAAGRATLDRLVRAIPRGHLKIAG